MPLHNELFDSIPEHYTIKHIIDNFDFYKVEKYMQEHNWTWATTKGWNTPNVIELQRCAEHLLTECRSRTIEHMSLGTGGFTVIKLYNELSLYFAIEESSDEYDEYKYDA